MGYRRSLPYLDLWLGGGALVTSVGGVDRHGRQLIIGRSNGAFGSAPTVRKRLRRSTSEDQTSTDTEENQQPAKRPKKDAADDLAKVLQNRPSQSKDQTGQQNQQQAANNAPRSLQADDLICPISLELPWEPVMAEDGRVYERECIEDHIKNNPWDLRSPITRARMGTRLLPAIQHRNTIETLVESGAIEEELADIVCGTKKKKRKREWKIVGGG
ncbi:expressed unknown protein [Seminavis robusta]|uniref:U-box domain-containing protein n=1 Tax=Seminavis robusta TaxID=568900 RepID=A0A9N8HBU0_9STRA|nr:expressed unknown protein [Seminavis robusta]|eukprot:Sro195_g083280.1 n/a (215) ;mRNA; f:75271-76144